MARARRVQCSAAAERGPPAVCLERGSADRQRQARHPPCPRAHVQGHLPPFQAHAGLSLPAQGRLGHPRPARRTRSGKGTRHLRQGRDRAPGGRGRVHPQVPRVGTALHRRLGADDRTHGFLGEPVRRLLHVRQYLHRVCLVAAPPDLGQGAPLQGLQGGSLRSAHRRHALLAGSRTRLQGSRGPIHLRAFSGARLAGHVLPRLDDHAVDTTVEPGPRRACRCRLPIRKSRGRDAHPCRSACRIRAA